MRVKTIITTLLAPIAAVVLLYGCGGSSGGGSGGGNLIGNGNTTVSAYVTDDLSSYKAVEFTLNTAQLRHTGINAACEIIRGPLNLDAAQLGRDTLLEMISTGECEARSYNRLHLEFSENVKLIEPSNVARTCRFTSYREGNSAPNTLACAGGTCSLDINGAVNLVARTHDHVALDIDLKAFEVDTTKTPCEVTMKVSPLHASGVDDKVAAGYRKGFTGTISDLNTSAHTFTLTYRSGKVAVQYAGVGDQLGLDTLLTRAAADGLRTRVRCESLNFETTPWTCITQTSGLLSMKAITVLAGGTISNLNVPLPLTFDLNYPVGKTLPVNYQTAVLLGEVRDTLANNQAVDVALYGFSLGEYLAREVEAQ